MSSGQLSIIRLINKWLSTEANLKKRGGLCSEYLKSPRDDFILGKEWIYLSKNGYRLATILQVENALIEFRYSQTFRSIPGNSWVCDPRTRIDDPNLFTWLNDKIDTIVWGAAFVL